MTASSSDALDIMGACLLLVSGYFYVLFLESKYEPVFE